MPKLGLAHPNSCREALAYAECAPVVIPGTLSVVSSPQKPPRRMRPIARSHTHRTVLAVCALAHAPPTATRALSEGSTLSATLGRPGFDESHNDSSLWNIPTCAGGPTERRSVRTVVKGLGTRVPGSWTAASGCSQYSGGAPTVGGSFALCERYANECSACMAGTQLWIAQLAANDDSSLAASA